MTSPFLAPATSLVISFCIALVVAARSVSTLMSLLAKPKYVVSTDRMFFTSLTQPRRSAPGIWYRLMPMSSAFLAISSSSECERTLDRAIGKSGRDVARGSVSENPCHRRVGIVVLRSVLARQVGKYPHLVIPRSAPWQSAQRG